MSPAEKNVTRTGLQMLLEKHANNDTERLENATEVRHDTNWLANVGDTSQHVSSVARVMIHL